MASRRLLPLVSMAAASLAAICVWLWVQLQQERQRNVELTARMASSPSTPAPVVPATPSASEPAPLSATVSPAPAATLAKQANLTAEAEEAARADWRTRQRRLMSDPRYREEIKRQHRLALGVRRDDAIRLLGFSEQEADAAIDLWAERESTMRGGWVEPGNAEEARAQRDAEERRYEASLRELLGDPRAAQWKHYRDSLPTRMRIANLRSQLTGADALRDDQFEPLIEAMEAEQSQLRQAVKQQREQFQFEPRPNRDRWREVQAREIEMYADTKKRVLSAAAPILSSSQLAKLDAMYEQEIESRRSNLRMSQLQQKIMPPPDESGDGD